MKDIFKISSVIVLFILAITLISNFVFWHYPLNYLSYETGYKTETINNLLEARHGRYTFVQSEYEQVCKNFNSKEVVAAYSKLSNISWALTGISLIIVVILFFALKLDTAKSFKHSKNVIWICVLGFILAAFMLISADMKEWDLDFGLVCNSGTPINGNLF